MNFNLYGSLNSAKLLLKPGLCLPHHIAPTFNDLPIPLDAVLQRDGRRANIKAVVLDKDDCFAFPDAKEVFPAYKVALYHVNCSLPRSLTEDSSNTLKS
jgi:phosphatidylglycerophosphatase GEP4